MSTACSLHGVLLSATAVLDVGNILRVLSLMRARTGAYDVSKSLVQAEVLRMPAGRCRLHCRPMLQQRGAGAPVGRAAVLVKVRAGISWAGR
jgi:hypothetical protein